MNLGDNSFSGGSSFVIVLYIVYKSILPSLDSTYEDLGALDLRGRILLGPLLLQGDELYSIAAWRKKTLKSLKLVWILRSFFTSISLLIKYNNQYRQLSKIP